jgi:Ser/Thr protein kinase RdoA (MazF antagonist)
MMDHASNERPFSLWPERPLVSKELALSLVQKYFDLEVVEVKELDSYQDRNFYLKTIQKHEDHENIEFVLKILNYVDSAIEGMVEAQSAAMLFLKDKGLVCPVPVLTSSGSRIVYRDCSKLDSSQIDDSRIGAVSNKLSAIRLLRYVPGELLKDVSVLTPDLLFDLGQYIGKLDEILKVFIASSGTQGD